MVALCSEGRRWALRCLNSFIFLLGVGECANVARVGGEFARDGGESLDCKGCFGRAWGRRNEWFAEIWRLERCKGARKLSGGSKMRQNGTIGLELRGKRADGATPPEMADFGSRGVGRRARLVGCTFCFSKKALMGVLGAKGRNRGFAGDKNAFLWCFCAETSILERFEAKRCDFCGLWAKRRRRDAIFVWL